MPDATGSIELPHHVAVPVDPDYNEQLVVVSLADLTDLAQRAANAEGWVEAAKSDLRVILMTLGITVCEELSAFDLVHGHILPKIEGLMRVSGLLAETEKELVRRVDDLQAPVIDLPDGGKAVRVGRRIPGFKVR